jgi:hypothetical protein
MQKKMLKKIIISLIGDDLKHLKLTGGLNLLGFRNENAELNISTSIFNLMGLNLNDKRLEHITNEYCDRTYIVNDFAGNDSDSFQRLAIEIYNWLSKEQRTYRKKLSNNS